MSIKVILQTERDRHDWQWLLDHVPMSQLLAVERSLGNRKHYVSNFARACRVKIPEYIPTPRPAAKNPADRDLDALLGSLFKR